MINQLGASHKAACKLSLVDRVGIALCQLCFVPCVHWSGTSVFISDCVTASTSYYCFYRGLTGGPSWNCGCCWTFQAVAFGSMKSDRSRSCSPPARCGSRFEYNVGTHRTVSCCCISNHQNPNASYFYSCYSFYLMIPWVKGRGSPSHSNNCFWPWQRSWSPSLIRSLNTPNSFLPFSTGSGPWRPCSDSAWKPFWYRWRTWAPAHH